MYFDKRRRTALWVILGVLLLVLVVVVASIWHGMARAEVQSETEYAIAETIRRTAMQCFSVEGFYPESLDYLQKNYGLRINTRDYYVVYEVFADNLPPNIRVARKKG